MRFDWKIFDVRTLEWQRKSRSFAQPPSKHGNPFWNLIHFSGRQMKHPKSIISAFNSPALEMCARQSNLQNFKLNLHLERTIYSAAVHIIRAKLDSNLRAHYPNYYWTQLLRNVNKTNSVFFCRCQCELAVFTVFADIPVVPLALAIVQREV